VTADAGVQTEGVLLLPTALRAHGARLQQQLSQRNITEHNTAHVRPHDAINAYARGSLAGAARGGGGQAEAGGEGGAGGEKASGGSAGVGEAGQGGGGVGGSVSKEFERRSSVLRRAKAQRITSITTIDDNNGDGCDSDGGESETRRCFFDHVPHTLPTPELPSEKSSGWKSWSGAWSGAGGEVGDAAHAADVVDHDADLLLEQELALDEEAADVVSCPAVRASFSLSLSLSLSLSPSLSLSLSVCLSVSLARSLSRSCSLALSNALTQRLVIHPHAVIYTHTTHRSTCSIYLRPQPTTTHRGCKGGGGGGG